MTARRRWPRSAKVTIAFLVVVFLAIAGRGGGKAAERATPSTAAVRPLVGLTTTTTTAATVTTARRRPSTTASPPPTHARPTTTTRRSAPAGAEQELANLPVAIPDYSRPYSRTGDFGPAWADVDRNGCDTRNDILRRDLRDITVRPGTHGCVVIGGVLHDPYSGTTITFVKAQAGDVQIDHVVPLRAAWSLGAFRWSSERRLAFANDPVVLRAVSGALNQSKGDRLADEWRPPNVGDWCDFARQTVAIHVRYALAVTRSEQQALAAMLARCPR